MTWQPQGTLPHGVGPKGDPGATGPKGSTGAAGAKGATGAAGLGYPSPHKPNSFLVTGPTSRAYEWLSLDTYVKVAGDQTMTGDLRLKKSLSNALQLHETRISGVDASSYTDVRIRTVPGQTTDWRARENKSSSKSTFYHSKASSHDMAGSSNAWRDFWYVHAVSKRSDPRTKRNMKRISFDALPKVKGAKVYRYTHDQHDDDYGDIVGFLAHEMADELRHTDEETGFDFIDRTGQFAVAWKALAELDAEVRALESAVTASNS